MGPLKEHSEILHVLFVHLRLHTFSAGCNCDQAQIKSLLNIYTLEFLTVFSVDWKAVEKPTSDMKSHRPSCSYHSKKKKKRVKEDIYSVRKPENRKITQENDLKENELTFVFIFLLILSHTAILISFLCKSLTWQTFSQLWHTRKEMNNQGRRFSQLRNRRGTLHQFWPGYWLTNQLA